MPTTPRTADDSVAVNIKGLSFSYNGSLVLKDVDLSVSAGEFMGIIGPNGGGKTTLVKLILGLLKPDNGSIQVLGSSARKASRRVGYVPQHLHIRPDFPITVEEIVLMGLVNAGGRKWRYSSADRGKASEVLHKVDLNDAADLRINELSGGQRQRVLIARALIANPELLILDEPTSNIDPHGKFCFFHFLEGLRRDITILIVSHDMSVLSSRLTSLACVNRQLVHSEKPELTEEMITLLYGSHDPHSCPAGEYFKASAGKLPEVKTWLS